MEFKLVYRKEKDNDPVVLMEPPSSGFSLEQLAEALNAFDAFLDNILVGSQIEEMMEVPSEEIETPMDQGKPFIGRPPLPMDKYLPDLLALKSIGVPSRKMAEFIVFKFGETIHHNTLLNWVNKNTLVEKKTTDVENQTTSVEKKTTYVDEKYPCPECGSNNVNKAGMRKLRRGGTKQKWHCKDCGRKYTEMPYQENYSDEIYDYAFRFFTDYASGKITLKKIKNKMIEKFGIKLIHAGTIGRWFKNEDMIQKYNRSARTINLKESSDLHPTENNIKDQINKKLWRHLVGKIDFRFCLSDWLMENFNKKSSTKEYGYASYAFRKMLNEGEIKYRHLGKKGKNAFYLINPTSDDPLKEPVKDEEPVKLDTTEKILAGQKELTEQTETKKTKREPVEQKKLTELKSKVKVQLPYEKIVKIQNKLKLKESIEDIAEEFKIKEDVVREIKDQLTQSMIIQDDDWDDEEDLSEF